MNAYRITFHDGTAVTAFGRSKPHAYRNGCRIARRPTTTLTRNIVAIPGPTLTW